jgi:hypothetical protein
MSSGITPTTAATGTQPSFSETLQSVRENSPNEDIPPGADADAVPPQHSQAGSKTTKAERHTKAPEKKEAPEKRAKSSSDSPSLPLLSLLQTPTPELTKPTLTPLGTKVVAAGGRTPECEAAPQTLAQEMGFGVSENGRILGTERSLNQPKSSVQITPPGSSMQQDNEPVVVTAEAMPKQPILGATSHVRNHEALEAQEEPKVVAKEEGKGDLTATPTATLGVGQSQLPLTPVSSGDQPRITEELRGRDHVSVEVVSAASTAPVNGEALSKKGGSKDAKTFSGEKDNAAKKQVESQGSPDGQLSTNPSQSNVMARSAQGPDIQAKVDPHTSDKHGAQALTHAAALNSHTTQPPALQQSGNATSQGPATAQASVGDEIQTQIRANQTSEVHGMVETARLMHGLNRSELHLNVNTPEFGPIGIHASLSKHVFTASISYERDALTPVLAANIESLNGRLQDHHGLSANISFQQGSKGNTPNSDRHNHQQHGTTERVVAEDTASVRAVTHTISSAGSSMLDVHA